MGYVITGVFMLIGLAAFGLFHHSRNETRFEPRPSLIAARRMIGRSRLVVLSVADGVCPCGGMTGPSGTVSPRYGQLYGCSGCRRTWTSDGRRVVRRPARPGRPGRTARRPNS